MEDNSDIRERVVRVETKVDFIIENMSSLPPSPETIKRFERIEEIAKGHTEFENELNKRIAWVTGAFAVIATGLGYFAKTVWDYISKTFWGS